jgi:phospholipase C
MPLAIVCCAALLGPAAYSAAASPRRHAPPQPDLQARLRQKIRYLFVIYQENRSFDSYFGTFPGAEGLYSHPASQTPGFSQPLLNTDGSTGTIHPFRIGPEQFAADTDDVDHSHPAIVAKEDIQKGVPQMDHFALVEERRVSPLGHPSLAARQFGELTMAHEDCDTIPLLWRYASRFALYDHIFQLVTGPSTLGNLAIIGAQTGVTQWVLHPEQAYKGNGAHGPGEPIVNDNDPFWGSQKDSTPAAQKMPVNPHDFHFGREYGTAYNQTWATLPFSTLGGQARRVTDNDSDSQRDLGDIRKDIEFLAKQQHDRVPFGWYQEGYGSKPQANTGADPTDAYGLHASYVTHHNGPQYFGYVANNKDLRQELHGLGDFYAAIASHTLPSHGIFFVKGGYRNQMQLTAADPDSRVQKNFRGDDDHPGYSDAQISEALVARTVNAIVRSP